MSERILVIGQSGQVATELARLALPPGVTLETMGRARFDLRDVAGVAEKLRAARPAAVINAAGYADVEGAESNEAGAFLLNRDGPAALARACADLGAPLVHLSTDYVFDGAKGAPYREDDARAPLSVYGRSKAAGEDAVLQSGAAAAILRTSWVFAGHGRNFVRTMLRLAETQDTLRVVGDQVGRPTWARDVAQASLDATLRLRAGGAHGVFHFAGAGEASWAEFAEAIFAAAAARGAKSARVERVTTAAFGAKAARPADSRLDTTKIEALGAQPRPWREALALCLDELLR